MNPIQKMTLHEKEFSKNDFIIKNFIIDNMELVSTKPIVDVAKNIPISKSSLLRFCQKCGYSGYSEFKYDISRFLHSAAFKENTNEKPFKNILNLYSNAINEFDETLYYDKVCDFAKEIINSTNIRIYGVNESGLSARQLSYRLATLGIDSEFINEEGSIINKSTMNKATQSLNIFFTLSCETSSIKQAISNCLKRNYSIAIITQNPYTKFYKKVNHFFLIPSINEERNRMYLNPQSLNFIFIELLITSISSCLEE